MAYNFLWWRPQPLKLFTFTGLSLNKGRVGCPVACSKWPDAKVDGNRGPSSLSLGKPYNDDNDTHAHGGRAHQGTVLFGPGSPVVGPVFTWGPVTPGQGWGPWRDKQFDWSHRGRWGWLRSSWTCLYLKGSEHRDRWSAVTFGWAAPGHACPLSALPSVLLRTGWKYGPPDNSE